MNQTTDWGNRHPGRDGAAGDRLDEAIVEAARTYPLDEAPATLSVGVMSRLRADRVQATHAPADTVRLPRFRLTWVDFALSLFFAAMLGVLLLVGSTLPPYLSAYLRLQARYWIQMLMLQPVLPLALAVFSLACAGGAVLLAARLAWLRGLVGRQPAAPVSPPVR